MSRSLHTDQFISIFKFSTITFTVHIYFTLKKVSVKHEEPTLFFIFIAVFLFPFKIGKCAQFAKIFGNFPEVAKPLECKALLCARKLHMSMVSLGRRS